MGLYERDYYREERSGLSLRAPTKLVGILIIINITVLLADFLFTPDARRGPRSISLFQQYFGAYSWTLTQPWFYFQFLTYGFVHSQQLLHLVLNMLSLWVFGNDVEDRYGRWEFLRFYLLSMVVGSVSWAAINLAQGENTGPLFGASGAVAATVVLFALNFPRRTILLYFVIPVPAWLVGVLMVLGDLYGATGRGDAHVAYAVHLTGAAFAFLYFQLNWNFGRLFNFDFSSWARWRRRPRLRVLHPENEDDAEHLNEDEVDRILAKIHREGESSLTGRERRTLQEASREYQRKRQQHGAGED